MKTRFVLILLMLCFVTLAYVAADALHVTNYGLDGNHPDSATEQASTTVNCIDNTNKVAVYMPAVTSSVYSQSTSQNIDVPVTYDPLTTAMFFEYNSDYIGDSKLSSLTPVNYRVLIVPMQQMSDAAATAINTYIENGGSVWFLNDPCLTPTGTTNADRMKILGTGINASINDSSTITIVSTDNITNGLPASFKPIGTTAKTAEFRSLSGSGEINGMNYQVLMSSGKAALLVKFENPATGARVIYSNPDMFISGGTSSYFQAQTASKLFLQAKTWVMKLANNPSGVEITYPGSDKQFLVTSDDEEAVNWEGTNMNAMFTVEKNEGVTPSAVNTLFIIPDSDTSQAELAYYAANGDTHTLHPHVTQEGNGYAWDIVGTSEDTYLNDIAASKKTIDAVMGVNDYGFTAWRFPFTTFCTNSMQAVSDSGFTIDSSAGIGSDSGVAIGNSQDNTVLFPKRMLINNAESNLIEMEIPAPLDDIASANGTDFYNQYNAFTSQFENGNFPMNFVVLCHYQGAGSNTLPGWGVTATGLTAGLGNIIIAEKSAKPEYANMDTLANYFKGIKSAKITAVVSGNITTVNVVNTKPITNFTIKSALGNVVSATCDAIAVTVKHDTLTNSSYITQTIGAGTHIFQISA